MSFETALEKTLSYEGWYSCEPDDRGGETWRGIARRHFQQWEGWKIIDSYKSGDNFFLDEAKKSFSLIEMVSNFYREFFWQRAWCDRYHDAVAEYVFDSAVNCGVRRSVRWLQTAASILTAEKIDTDGIPGAITCGLELRCRPDALVELMRGQRIRHYVSIVKNDETQRKFIFGWVNRALG